MIVFLTSNPGGRYQVNGQYFPCEMDNSNGFVDKLRKIWDTAADILIISSDPDNYERNDSMRYMYEESFPLSGLPIRRIDICDRRSNDFVSRISEYGVVILSGGHVPTQNLYFQEIHLKEALSEFEGIVIGISAGSMNSAGTVYAQPELEGEASNPGYQRFLSGLGLTEWMILPHYQEIKDDVVDGMRVMEDIAYPDSDGKQFLCLVDGSYVLIAQRSATLFGEGYLLRDGRIEQICEKDRSVPLA